MAETQERIKLQSGVNVEIANVKVEHLLSVSGAEINIPQVDVSSGEGKETEYTAGRISYSPLVIEFANAKNNTKFIKDAIAYAKDPQNGKRCTIAINEQTQSNTSGASMVCNECFCTDLQLPDFKNTEGVLTTRMVWCVERVDWVKAGRA